MFTPLRLAQIPRRITSARQGIKSNGRRIGNVQTFHLFSDRNERPDIATLPDEPPQPFAFRAQNKGHVAFGARLVKGLLAVSGQRNPPEARGAQFFESTCDVDNTYIGNHVECARCGLGQNARFRRRMAILHDNGADAKSDCGTQDGPYIVRVGDLVEHEHEARDARAGAKNAFQIALRQWIAKQHGALMDGARRQKPPYRVGFRLFPFHAPGEG